MNKKEFFKNVSHDIELKSFLADRDRTESTKRYYNYYISSYCYYHKMTPSELLDEAINEEQNTQIHASRRRIKKRILSYKEYLKNERKLNPKTLQNRITIIKAFYVFSEASFRVLNDFKIRLREFEYYDGDIFRTIKLESLIKIAEASAKIRLSKRITKNDAKNAIELQLECLKEAGYYLDIEIKDIMKGRILKSDRDVMKGVIKIIKELSESYGGIAPESVVIYLMEERYSIIEEKTREIVQKLKVSMGLLFEPQEGYLKLV